MIRIVKMTFKPEMINDFLALFNEAKPKIEAFPGCIKVDLLRDINHGHILMTHSLWKTPEDLENYRNSALFAATWARTKVMFDAKAEAWSVEKIN